MSFLLHSWDIYGYVKSLKGTATSPGFEGLRLMPQRLNETDIRYIWSWRWWVKYGGPRTKRYLVYSLACQRSRLVKCHLIQHVFR